MHGGWVVSALLYLGICSNAFAEDARDCALKQLASLPLISTSRPIVEVGIGDKKYHFLVDTGGVATEIDSDIADALGLTQRPITSGLEIYDMTGAVAKKYVRVEHVVLDHLHADHLNMVVQERDPNDKDIDGILGPDVLAQYDVEFDFGGGRLNLISQDRCPGRAVYWASAFTEVDFTLLDGHIHLPMILDGHDVVATVDTGSNATLLAENVASDVFGLNGSSPGMEILPDAAPGDVVRSRYRFGSLSVGGLGIKNPLVYIMRDVAQEAFRKKHNDKLDQDPVYGVSLKSPQMILGMNVLSKLHLYIAYKEHVLYLTGAKTH